MSVTIRNSVRDDVLEALKSSTHDRAANIADDLRDYIPQPEPEEATWLDRCAWAAMAGACANPNFAGPPMSTFTREAYAIADAMLAEKRRREGGAASAVANPDGTVILRPGTWSVNGKIIVVPEGESKAVSLNTGSAGGAA